MRTYHLRLDDEFSYLGVDYLVHDIQPPNVMIKRLDGDLKVREVEFLKLISDSSFQLKNGKRKIEIDKKVNERRYFSQLDNLPEDQRQKVSDKYEMIKPILIYEKIKNGDVLSAVIFNEIYKEYLYDDEKSILEISKKALFKRVSKKCGKSVRQLERYLSLYKSTENEIPTKGMEGLIRKDALGRQKRKDEIAVEVYHPKNKEIILDTLYIRLGEEYKPIFEEAISSVYLTKRRPQITELHNYIEMKCVNKGLNPPSYNDIYKMVEERMNPNVKDLMREGNKIKDLVTMTNRGFSNQFPVAPLHVVQIDHTELDMDVIDSESGVNLGRPYITLGIDVYTRMVWCMHISFENPSANKVRKAIMHGIFMKHAKEKYKTLNEWDIYGIPRIIYTDNGKEFKNAEVKRMIDETLESQQMFRPVSTPRYGATIERLFGTINKKLIHRLAGTRKSNPIDLGEYDAENEAIFTLEDITEILTCYIVDQYHHEKHQSLPFEYPTPSAMYYQAINVLGFPEFIPHDEEHYYEIELLATKMRMYSNDGVRLGTVRYVSSETSHLINRQKIKYKIKHDIDDISKIFILDPSTSEYIEVPAHDPPAESIKGMSLQTYQKITKELRKKGSINTQQIPGSRDIMKGKELLAEKIKSKMKKNKKMRQAALKSGFKLAANAEPKKAIPQNTQPKSKIEELRDRLNYEKSKKRESSNNEK